MQHGKRYGRSLKRLAEQLAHQPGGVVDSAGRRPAGLLVPVPIRAVLWIVALTWMGTACILNARRCGRTHCRYTGPFYLAMVAPVLVLASGIVAVDFYGWLALAVLILAGSKIIWWATERAWGQFS